MSLHHQLAEELQLVIEQQWEETIRRVVALQGLSLESGKLYLQRGRYFLYKMECSLRKVEVDPPPIRTEERDIRVENEEEDPLTVQFNNICDQLVQTQEISPNRFAQVHNKVMTNNVSVTDFKTSQQDIDQAIKIFQREIEACQPQQKEEITAFLNLAKAKRAILLMIGAKYSQAAAEFEVIINRLKEKKGGEQLIAQYTFLVGNCILLQDKDGCGQQALELFLTAIKMYFNHLKHDLAYKVEQFCLPTKEKTKVDRYPYLTKHSDPQDVRLAKEVMSIILDKIEDVAQLVLLKTALKDTQKEEKVKTETARAPRKRQPSEGKLQYKDECSIAEWSCQQLKLQAGDSSQYVENK